MLALYHYDASVCSQKVRLVLAAKQLPWESRPVDLRAAQQYTPEFRRINPKAEVPVLEHDGARIFESTVINEYLDDTFAQPPLRPADARERAAMRWWPLQADMALHAACGALTFAVLAPQRRAALTARGQTVDDYVAAMPDVARRDRQREVLLQGLDAPVAKAAVATYALALDQMENALRQASHLAGDRYTLADAALTPYVLRLDMFGFQRAYHRRPKLRRWMDRMRQHANFSQAIDPFMPATLSESFASAGREARDRFDALLQAADSLTPH